MLPNHPQKPAQLDRTIKDAQGTSWRLWEVEPKSKAFGTAYCIVVFVSPTERRWLPALRGSLACEHPNALLRQLREAKVLPAGKAIPEPQAPEPPRAFVNGKWEEGA